MPHLIALSNPNEKMRGKHWDRSFAQSSPSVTELDLRPCRQGYSNIPLEVVESGIEMNEATSLDLLSRVSQQAQLLPEGFLLQ